MEMNRNVKGAIIVLVFAVIAFVVYKLLFKSGSSAKLSKGYAKRKGEWVACSVTDYDKDYYSGVNTAGTTIYFKKSDVNTRKNYKAENDTCADASRDMNVYSMA